MKKQDHKIVICSIWKHFVMAHSLNNFLNVTKCIRNDLRQKFSQKKFVKQLINTILQHIKKLACYPFANTHYSDVFLKIHYPDNLLKNCKTLDMRCL